MKHQYDDGHDVTWHLEEDCVCGLNGVEKCLSCLAREEIERLRLANADLAASIPHIIAGVRAAVRVEIERERAAVSEHHVEADAVSVEGGRDALCALVIDPRIDRSTRAMIQMGIDAIDRAVADVERLSAQVAAAAYLLADIDPGEPWEYPVVDDDPSNDVR